MTVVVMVGRTGIGGRGGSGGGAGRGHGRAPREVGDGVSADGAEAALGGAEVIADAFGVHLVEAGESEEFVACLERYIYARYVLET